MSLSPYVWYAEATSSPDRPVAAPTTSVGLRVADGATYGTPSTQMMKAPSYASPWPGVRSVPSLTLNIASDVKSSTQLVNNSSPSVSTSHSESAPVMVSSMAAGVAAP